MTAFSAGLFFGFVGVCIYIYGLNTWTKYTQQTRSK